MNPQLQQPIDEHQEIFNEAARRGVPAAKIIIEKGGYRPVGLGMYWPQPILSGSIDAKMPDAIDIVQHDSLLGQFSQSISKTIQFPVNTIFAHGLGIVASTMSKSFSFEYGSGAKPVNLYMVTAQPPSSGKSGVHEILSDPAHLAFQALNKKSAAALRKIKLDYARLKAESKQASTKEEQYALEDSMIALLKQKESHVVYIYAVDDATSEGTGKMALNQAGIFNIISAEADAINVILGDVYSDKKSNHGTFLKGWDCEYHSIVRASQDTLSGRLIGNISVIAQDESIKTILAAGESGRGISERFLLVREPTHLGKRKHGKRIPIDANLSAEYSRLIFNIVQEGRVTIKFNDASLDLIDEYRRKIEPEMGDTGKYSNNMMRGFIGKADKQILKIASILHTIENWRDKGTRSLDVKEQTTKAAIHIFEEIAKAYTHAADDLGFTGSESEYRKVEECLSRYAEKGRMSVTVGQLRSAIKGGKPFTGTPNLTSKLRDQLFPVLELNGICVVHDSKIYINPNLKG